MVSQCLTNRLPFLVLNCFSVNGTRLCRRVLSARSARLDRGIECRLVGFIVQNKCRVTCRTDRVEKLHEGSQSLLVLRADEHHAMLADVLLYMLTVVVPVVRLECVLDQRTIESGEAIRGLLDKLDEIGRQHHDDSEAVVDGSGAERNHRDRLATLHAPIQEPCWRPAVFRCCVAGYRGTADADLASRNSRGVSLQHFAEQSESVLSNLCECCSRHRLRGRTALELFQRASEARSIGNHLDQCLVHDSRCPFRHALIPSAPSPRG